MTDPQTGYYRPLKTTKLVNYEKLPLNLFLCIKGINSAWNVMFLDYRRGFKNLVVFHRSGYQSMNNHKPLFLPECVSCTFYR